MPELTSLLGQLGGTVGADVDWEAVARAYGTRLPRDFEDFTARYGYGSIEDQLVVLAPDPCEPEPHAVSRFSRGFLDEARLHEGWESPELAREHPLEKMLIWGDTVGADTLCWFTADPDPDAWPVAVFSRSSLTWSLHECGMTEFLVRILRGDLADYPLSDESLLGWGEARFLHLKDERALAQEDTYTDPWE
ncbi:hypothetical protein [Streptomyces sp. NPDC094049]|uniref:hypothetical protein n=1 Tax=Streptomyces sp. NPDC094049 TaxID=3154987 RepID=UPI00331E97FA